MINVLGILPAVCFLLAYKKLSYIIIAEQQLKRLIENKDKEVKNEHS